ncbi:Nucleosome assembly protein (NAP) [Novymonas esmeraldas]|uniref:Nucleosome assembly protein (NAP) n=1 Tax=Novymonas esmeraldas TaxID=1808958 RepID=A0AAW0F0X1_9TRYP
MEAAQTIQAKLNELNNKQHREIDASDAKFNLEKNAIFAARRAVIADLIKSGELPSNFWALAFLSLLKTKSDESPTMPHFLGAYDEALLKAHLVDMEVEYTEQGHRITLRFTPNPFFEETELWAELQKSEVDAEEDAEEDGSGAELTPLMEVCVFSGITWKDGHGPLPYDHSDHSDDSDDDNDDDDDEGAEDNGVGAPPGTKRPRPADASAAAPSATQGSSVLEVFSEMPPHPDDETDEETSGEDEDFGNCTAEAVEEWEAEMEDRKTLLRLMEEFIHYDPVSSIRAAAEPDADSDGDAAEKRARVE